MSELAVIINRNAVQLRQEGPLLDKLRDAPGVVHETHTPSDLQRVARSIRERETQTVMIAGGDGSLMAGLSALHDAYGMAPLPRIAIAPGGTVNTVARNFGSHGSSISVASRLVASLASGTVQTIASPTLCVDAKGTTLVGFIFGFGLVSGFFDAYYGASDETVAREKLGLARAARIVGRVFAESFVGGSLSKRMLAPQPARVQVDAETLSLREFSLFVASVVPDLGLHMRLTHRARTRADRFHVVGSSLGPTLLGPQMPLVLAGRPLLGRRVDELASDVEIVFTSERRSFVLDGEVFAADAVRVRVGPAIHVVIPARRRG